MFGSQALDTALGLVLLFFIVATAASAITEVIARLLRKRATELERGIAAMLTGVPGSARASNDKTLLDDLKNTSVWQAALEVTSPGVQFLRDARPSYLSAKAFADAVTEMVFDEGGSTALGKYPNLQKRLQGMFREGQSNVLEVKAGLESWFDEAMSRLEGAYKRWATLMLFSVGLLLAGALNASTISVAQELWKDPVTRAAVADAAGRVVQEGSDPTTLDSLAETTDTMIQLSLPVGWSQGKWDAVWAGIPSASLSIAGWLLTALFVMLGAPFWFDLLSRLSSLRNTGSKPDPAVKDNTSATNRLIGLAGSEGGLALLGAAKGAVNEEVGAEIGDILGLAMDEAPARKLEELTVEGLESARTHTAARQRWLSDRKNRLDEELEKRRS